MVGRRRGGEHGRHILLRFLCIMKNTLCLSIKCISSHNSAKKSTKAPLLLLNYTSIVKLI